MRFEKISDVLFGPINSRESHNLIHDDSHFLMNFFKHKSNLFHVACRPFVSLAEDLLIRDSMKREAFIAVTILEYWKYVPTCIRINSVGRGDSENYVQGLKFHRRTLSTLRVLSVLSVSSPLCLVCVLAHVSCLQSRSGTRAAATRLSEQPFPRT